MSMKKIMATIGLASALALGGCGNLYKNYPYTFTGKIGNEVVEFRTDGNGMGPIKDVDSYLTIIKNDGTVVVYFDLYSDSKLDSVSVNDVEYTDDIVGKRVLERAERKYKEYLSIIMKEKRRYGLEKM